MSTYKIEGGVELTGTVTPVPNKNAVLPAITAALLTNEPVTIHNFPKGSDMRLMLRIIRKLGGKVAYSDGGSTVRITADSLNTNEIDAELAKKMKAGTMFMAPLLMRFKSAFMPIPGGCKLGTRPLDAFIKNMESLGVTYEPTNKGFYLHAENIQAQKVWSWFPSVTGTENLIMMAVLIPGETEIYNAACEPHVQELCHMLVSMGAHIEGIGSNRLKIHGVERLGGTEWTIISDHLDIAEYIASAAITGGEIRVEKAIPEHMGLIRQAFSVLGVETYYEEDTLVIPSKQKKVISETLKGDIFDIKAFFWPLFPPDVVHSLVVTALDSQGTMIFSNTFYEYGFFFVEQLANMKARILMSDPTKVVTFGPTEWRAGEIHAPNIIAAAKSLFVAALAGNGTTILHDSTDQLMRRYPDIVNIYKKLGAKVKKI